MYSRRKFIQNTALALSSAVVSPYLVSCANEVKEISKNPFQNIGLQLWSLRDYVVQDAKRTLQNVKKIGITHIETFDIQPKEFTVFGMQPKELKKFLDDLNLKTHSGHYDISNYLISSNTHPQENLEKYIEVASDLGQSYIIAPVSHPWLSMRPKSSDYQRFAERLNKAGELSKQAGIKIGYHNHFWEFEPLDNGTKGLDIMIAYTDPELVCFEMDFFWASVSGESPYSYFEKYPERFPLWHVKDVDKSMSVPLDLKKDYTEQELDGIVKFAEVGTGTINYKNLAKEKEKAGLKYAFIEQDVIYRANKYDSIAASFDYIKKNF